MLETIGKLSKQGLRFWHDKVNHGPQKGPKTDIFARRIVFTLSCMGSDSKRPKRHLCTGSPVPKVLTMHALEKVLTNETPSIELKIR